MSNEYGPYTDEYEALEAYRDMLNEVYGQVMVCGYAYDTGDALAHLDPTAFRIGFNEWLDSEVQEWELEQDDEPTEEDDLNA